MKKIMFNDKYGLTQAVLEGRKTMTRRSIPKKLLEGNLYARNEKEFRYWLMANSSYQLGEVVAIAQCYYNVYGYETWISERGEKESGVFNKMFVRAESMPHNIKITNIRVEHLQDISYEDCLREGVVKNTIGYYVEGLKCKDWEKESHIEMENGETLKLFPTPREAFAALIDKVSGRGTWDSNPFVWVYEFDINFSKLKQL